ncbi:hypothetical protein LCGC14_2589110, partial [marine sediment metagenome]
MMGMSKLGVSFVALNVVDALLTIHAIDSNSGYEGNPVLAWMGPWEFTAAKVVLPVTLALLLVRRKGVMIALNIGIALVVIWNLLA